MIPEELQKVFDESEGLKDGAAVNPATIISHNSPQGRVRTLQIRLTDEEYEQLATLAGDKPVSTVARSLLFAAASKHDTRQAQAEQALRDALSQAGYTLTKIENKAA